MSLDGFKLKTRKFFHKHGPGICTTAGVIQMTSATVLAVLKTKQALEHIEEANIPEDATKIEKAKEVTKACWKDYAPALALEMGGALLIFGSKRTLSRRSSELSNMLMLSETAYRNLQNKMEEKLTKKQITEIRDSIAEDKVKQDPPESHTIIITDRGNHMFYDSMSGQYFRSSFESVNNAIYEIRNKLLKEDVCYNELLYEFGANQTPIFNRVGWLMGTDPCIRQTNITVNGEAITTIDADPDELIKAAQRSY